MSLTEWEVTPDTLWIMATIRIGAVRSPFDNRAVAHLTVTVLTRAEAMGLLPATEMIDRLDLPRFRRLVEGIAEADIGNGLLTDLAGSPSSDPRRLLAILRKLNEALEASPTPDREWG